VGFGRPRTNWLRGGHSSWEGGIGRANGPVPLSGASMCLCFVGPAAMEKIFTLRPPPTWFDVRASGCPGNCMQGDAVGGSNGEYVFNLPSHFRGRMEEVNCARKTPTGGFSPGRGLQAAVTFPLPTRREGMSVRRDGFGKFVSAG